MTPEKTVEKRPPTVDDYRMLLNLALLQLRQLSKEDRLGEIGLTELCLREIRKEAKREE